MTSHPVRQIIEDCDRAISAGDFDAVMEHYTEDAALVIKPGMIARGKSDIRQAFGLISDYFQGQLQVTQGDMQVIEGGGRCPGDHGNSVNFPGPARGTRGNQSSGDLCFSEGTGRTLVMQH